MSTRLDVRTTDQNAPYVGMSLAHNPLIDLVLLAFWPQNVPEDSPTRLWIKHHPVVTAIALAYGLTWIGALGVMADPAAPAQRNLSAYSLLYAFFFVGGCLWAALIVANATTGRRALVDRLLRWRVNPVWYLVALFFPALYILAGTLLNSLFGGTIPELPLQTVPVSAWALVVAINFGVYMIGNYEEFIWRGTVLPRLQTRYNALTAALILGVVQTVWHLPYWFIPNSIEQQLGPFGFLAWNVGLNVVITWVFNNSKGSLLIAQLFHAANDTWGGLLAALGDSRPLYLSIAVLFVISAVLLIGFGYRRLSRKSEAEIAPAAEAGHGSPVQV